MVTNSIDLQSAFSETPEDFFRYGIIDHSSGAVDFFRITESDEKNVNPDADLQNPPKKIEIFDFAKDDWTMKPGLMNKVNDERFEFMDRENFGDLWLEQKCKYDEPGITRLPNDLD